MTTADEPSPFRYELRIVTQTNWDNIRCCACHMRLRSDDYPIINSHWGPNGPNWETFYHRQCQWILGIVEDGMYSLEFGDEPQ